MNVLIRPEASADHDAIRRVHRLAFGQGDKARLVDALRDGWRRDTVSHHYEYELPKGGG
jgi:predicted N-acetyltransferase YhbS